MGATRVIRATSGGALEGVRAIALHGRLHASATPALAGAVYADEDDQMLRVVESRPAAHGFDVRVEIAHPPLPAGGDLPGQATRIGPWKATLGHHVVILGPSEILRADRLGDRSVPSEPAAVRRLVEWLMTGRGRDEDLRCERLESAAAWYCSREESLALFHRIHGVVEGEYLDAARRFREEHPESRGRLEDASWWLARAAIGPDDVYRAGAGLRRAGSASWRRLLREGLRLRETW